MAPDPSALGRLVGDASGFVTTAWGRTPFVRRAADLDGVLSLDDVDRALTTGGLRRPAVRVVREGAGVDPARWTRRVRTGSVTVDDLVDPDRALAAFAGGDTLVLQSMQRWWEPVAALCRGLEADLGHAVQANAYLTPAGATGLAPHHDTHDVFVIQLHGSKHWTLRDPVVVDPLRRHRSTATVASASPVRDEIELRAGDVLYLPRGHVHSASAQSGTSLHLTLGVLATTGHDVVTRVAALAAEDERIRASLPLGWADDPEVARAAVRAVIESFRSFLDRLDPDEVAAEMATRRRSARPSSLRGLLVDLDRVDTIDDDTVVVRRPTVVPEVRVVDDRVVVRAGRKEVDLPRAAEAPVRRLLGGVPVRVGELADQVSAGSRLVLVRRLVADGLLTIEAS